MDRIKIKRHKEEPEWVVFLFIILLLGGGIILKTLFAENSLRVQLDNVNFKLPSYWVQEDLFSDKGNAKIKTVFKAGDLLSSSSFAKQFAVYQYDHSRDTAETKFLSREEAAILPLQIHYREKYDYFKELAVSQKKIREREFIQFEYYWLYQANKENSAPVLVYGLDLLLETKDHDLLFSLQADSQDKIKANKELYRIAESLDINPGEAK